MTLAILCSGQGHQNPEMFALTGETAGAAYLFASATMLLNQTDPRVMVRRDAGIGLFENRTAQILCTLQPLAAMIALRESIPPRAVFAGYSVGEIAAWGAAGIFRHLDTLKLVARRAELMSANSSKGDGLVFIKGLGYRAIRRLCEEHETDIAIINPGDAFIVGGSQASLAAIAAAAEEAGASRIVRIPVEVASHTPLLAEAADEFRTILDGPPKTFPPPFAARVQSGVDGDTVAQLNRGLDKLASQISHTVRWADNLQACTENGAVAFLELGPGRALADMAAEAYPDIPSRSLDDFKTLNGVKAWISKWTSK